jgi:hypothetical protein
VLSVDARHRFDHKDFLWCPRHAGTPRQFECSRLITAAQVTRAIQCIPGFGTHQVPAHEMPAKSKKEKSDAL